MSSATNTPHLAHAPSPRLSVADRLERFNANMSELTLDKIFSKIPPQFETSILVDGANIGTTTSELNFEIDYKKLYNLFRKRCNAYTVWYFNGYNEDEDQNGPTQKKLTWMDHNNIRVVSKPIKRIMTQSGKIFNKANMDVEITITALEHCRHARHIILMTGDGDFRYLVETLQRRDIIVTVISTESPEVTGLSYDLRKQADNFIDLVAIRDHIKFVPDKHVQR